MLYLTRIGGALALAALTFAGACDHHGVHLPSSANTTLSLVPSTIQASGTSAVAITLMDSAGAPVSGATVTIEIDGGGVDITQPTGLTGADGVANAQVTATLAGERQLRIVVLVGGSTTTFTLPGFLTVDPAAPSATHSAVAISPSTLPADGVTTGTVTVQARDDYDNAIPGAQIALALDVPGAVLDGTSLTADAGGDATTTIHSSFPGAVHVQATITVGTDVANVSAQPTATFEVPLFADETEPNDDAANANTLYVGTACYGTVVDQADVDTWKLALHTGDAIEIEVFGSRFDQTTWSNNGNRPRLTVWDATGPTKLVEHDYSGNDSSNPWYWDDQDLDIPVFMVPHDGDYLITVTADDQNAGGGAYALRVSQVDLGTTVGEGSTLFGTSRIVGFHDDDQSDDYTITVLGQPAIVRASVMGYRLGVNHDGANTPDYYDTEIGLFAQGGGSVSMDNDDECFYDSGFQAFVDPGDYTYWIDECCGAADAPYISDVTITPFDGTTETEPNDDVNTAMLVTDGAMLAGATTSSDLDYFAIQATAGDAIRVDVLGAYAMLPGAANLDTIDFEIRDPADQVRGSTTSTHLEVLANATGTWYVTARAQSSTNPVGYAIRLSIENVASESEPNDDIASATVVVGSAGVCGTVSSVGDVDVFRVTASAAGELVHLAVICANDGYVPNQLVNGLRSQMVAQLVVRDGSGNVINSTDGSTTPYPQSVTQSESTCEVAFRAPAAGTFYVNVVEAYGNGGDTYYYVIRRVD
ncbi:MAG: Ig-like domain-containing protein [Planctomycetota bacterium]